MGKCKSKVTKGVEAERREGKVQSHTPAKPVLKPHVILPRCTEIFLCESRGEQQRCFSLLSSLPKHWCLLGTAFTSHHHHQEEVARPGVTDFSGAMVPLCSLNPDKDF